MANMLQLPGPVEQSTLSAYPAAYYSTLRTGRPCDRGSKYRSIYCVSVVILLDHLISSFLLRTVIPYYGSSTYSLQKKTE